MEMGLVWDGGHVLAEQYIHSGNCRDPLCHLFNPLTRTGSSRLNRRRILEHNDRWRRVYRWLLGHCSCDILFLFFAQDVRHALENCNLLGPFHIYLCHAGHHLRWD